MFGLNVQTLYYYDSIHLFSPSKRDSTTGKRFYYFDQVYKLASIRFMRRLGYSIDQIKSFLDVSDIDKSLEGLRRRSQEMQEKWKELLFIDQVIQRKLMFIENQMQTIDIDSVEVKRFPERFYMPIGEEESLYFHDSFYFYPTIVFYYGKERIFGALLGENTHKTSMHSENASQVEKEIIPAGDFICAYHKGPYTTIHESYERASKSFPALHHRDEFISFNVIDQFVEINNNNFITEIQIPIIKD